MMVEEQLRATLERVAAVGPQPPVDLIDRVETGHRRRRRVRRAHQAAWTGLAVLAVVAAVAVLPRTGTGPVVTTSPTPSPSVVTAPMVKNAPPAEQVWPQAVVTVPIRFGAGVNEPITMLDEHRMLLAIRVSEDTAHSLAVYDLRTRTEQLLTDLSPPSGLRGYWPGGFTAADGLIVWTAYAFGKDESKTYEYWSMRDDGTGKRRFATAQQMIGDRLVVAAGALYGSSVDRGGIVRMPLAGGTPEKIAGSEGFEIARWPWAVTAGPLGTQQPSAWNLITGERRTPTPRPQATPWWTAADQDIWLGLDANRLTFVQATDGSWEVISNSFDARTLTGGWLVGGTLKNLLHTDDPKQSAIWDLRTGLVGTYGVPNVDTSSLRQQVVHPLIWWSGASGLQVLDPARISAGSALPGR